MYLHNKVRMSYLDKSALIGAFVFSGALATGCTPDVIKAPDMGSLEDPAVDPRSLFETQVKPEMQASCSCHALMQESFGPFLKDGEEYASITGYSSGKFLTMAADQSLLLNKGAHQGPAFSAEQKAKVLAWLQGEVLSRGSANSTPTTPSVAIRTGDFYISLDSLVQDPLAKITFTLSAFGSGYRVTNLTLTAGPTTGIHVKHPRFIIFSATSAASESSDALSTVDTSTVNPSASVLLGTGSLLLNNLPATTARLALAFEQIDKVGTPGPPPMCKNFAMFNPAVKNRLATCAALCHSPQGTDPRKGGAQGYNMSAALGSDTAALELLCIYSLGRINLTDVSRSILLLQPQPPTMGGTPNHPYKLDANTFPPYSADVTAWGNGEK
jgi:hypothetical protein